MAQSQPIALFGIHSMTPYDRTNLKPFGAARVLQNSTIALEGDTIDLFGGSNRFAWQTEDGDINASLSFSVSEYPDWIFTLFGGKAPTVNPAEPLGNVTAITPVKGESIVAAAGLLSAIAIENAQNLKAGVYTIVATAVDAFDVYASSDVDFGRGDILDYLDDALRIASFTSLVQDETYAIEELGIEFSTGATATAFVVGDSASFTVRPVNKGSRSVTLGGIADVFPEFGAYVYAQKAGSGRVVEIDCFKCKAIGLSLGAARKEFSSSDYTAKLTYDAARNGILAYRDLQ